MSGATFQAFLEQTMRKVCDGLDLTYDEVVAQCRQDEREQVRRLWQEAQDLTAKRAAALSPDSVTYSPASTDKKLARELTRRLLSDRPFTPRQCQVAAYLAWRYRRQISGRLVPSAPVSKP